MKNIIRRSISIIVFGVFLVTGSYVYAGEQLSTNILEGVDDIGEVILYLNNDEIVIPFLEDLEIETELEEVQNLILDIIENQED